MKTTTTTGASRRRPAARLTLLLCAACLVAPLHGGEPKAAPRRALDGPALAGEPLAVVFMRTMLVVRDLEASKRFYTRAFGLRVEREVDLDDALTKAQLGIPISRRARFALLVTDGVINGRRRPSASIGLLQLADPASTPLSRPVGEVLAIGEHAMALRTNDIGTVHARLQELGARYAVPPVSTDDGSATELVVYDPDGLRIHVVQRPDSPRDF
jgi:catechol 2,3-dioxygenase-like lactoylglutathione lyase family enzyme